ncbi:MAG TPA: cysteine hydrolase family protein [Allosphingosinicella sp.]|uniref:cysteine hydrolase family protein n=1 Tax=Allosphingosinicella sp. TaxID=2823234 RepID=UPI002ED79610
MKALVIIDVQKGMFAFPEAQPHEGEAVVARIAELLSRARAAGAPVLFVQHSCDEEGDPLHPDGPGFPFRDELAPHPSEPVIVKTKCSAFQATDLAERLSTAGVDHLVICGMQTEYCVDTSIRSAFEQGYEITLVADGHTTFDTPVLPAAQIIAHHNHTLRGFAKPVPAVDVRFD